jgi:hypothetical protein
MALRAMLISRGKIPFHRLNLEIVTFPRYFDSIIEAEHFYHETWSILWHGRCIAKAIFGDFMVALG